MCIFLIYTMQLLDLQIVNRVQLYKRQEGQMYASQLAIIVNNILLESGIRGFTLSRRLVQAFKTKIISLHAAFKRSKGGNPVKRLLNTWQNSSYSVTTYYNELETDKLDLLRLLSFADFLVILEHLDEGLEVQSLFSPAKRITVSLRPMELQILFTVREF